MKGRLEEAFRSGSLDEAVRKAIEGEVAPEAEPEAAEAPMDDIVKLQIQLRAVMLDAVESLGIFEISRNRSGVCVFRGRLLAVQSLGEFKPEGSLAATKGSLVER